MILEAIVIFIIIIFSVSFGYFLGVTRDRNKD